MKSDDESTMLVSEVEMTNNRSEVDVDRSIRDDFTTTTISFSCDAAPTEKHLQDCSSTAYWRCFLLWKSPEEEKVSACSARKEEAEVEEEEEQEEF